MQTDRNTRHPWVVGRGARILLVAALVAGVASSAAAQTRQGPAVDASAGWVGFADDGIVNETLTGFALRWYVARQLAVGPEVVYVRGDDHSHVSLTGNLVWDLRPAGSRITPFLVAGAGVMRTRQAVAGGGVSWYDATLTAGGGVRFAVGERITVGVDLRAGWEPNVRVAGVLGWRLGR